MTTDNKTAALSLRVVARVQRGPAPHDPLYAMLLPGVDDIPEGTPLCIYPTAHALTPAGNGGGLERVAHAVAISMRAHRVMGSRIAELDEWAASLEAALAPAAANAGTPASGGENPYDWSDAGDSFTKTGDAVMVPAGKLRAWRDLLHYMPDGVRLEISALLAAQEAAK